LHDEKTADFLASTPQGKPTDNVHIFAPMLLCREYLTIYVFPDATQTEYKSSALQYSSEILGFHVCLSFLKNIASNEASSLIKVSTSLMVKAHNIECRPEALFTDR
jgi:hypothetical protein